MIRFRVTFILVYTTTTSHSSIAAVPLMIVTAISLVREGAEDYEKHKSDHEINTNRLRSGGMQWQDIAVGQTIRILENETIPADLLIIGSSDSQNVAYIQTKNLDGETNLKLKQVVQIDPHRTFHIFVIIHKHFQT